MIIEVIHILSIMVLYYFIVLSFGYIVLLAASIRDIALRSKESQVADINEIMDDNNTLPVTVIISAFNIQNHILNTVYSIIKNSYPNTHIIVVNDGSEDNTLNNLHKVFSLEKIDTILPKKIKTGCKMRGYYVSKKYKSLMVLDKEHTGKSDSLNMALNACRTPLFITVDADTILDPDAIAGITYYMLIHARAVTAGGAVYVLNGCKYKDGKILKKGLPLNPLCTLQACEYLRSFLFNRSGWNLFGGALCYSGTFTLFSHKDVLEIGGFDSDNPAQDFEIITHLQAYNVEKNKHYNLGYTPSAAAWTLVPNTFSRYWKQRITWQKYTLESLFLHIRMLFNPRYGIVGMVTYPFYLFGEILGACVEFLAYVLAGVSWYLGIIDINLIMLFVVIAWGFVTLLTMVTALISMITFNQYGKLSNLLWILLIVIIENFGFRQYSVLCRVIATWKFILSKLTFIKR